MTLNGVIALMLRFFTEFDSLLANYVTVVEDCPQNVVSQFQAFTFVYKKLRYREEHSASVVLSWCTL